MFDLYENFESEKNLADRQEMARKLVRLICEHSTAEELILYPAFCKAIPNGESIVKQNLAEHQELKENLDSLNSLNVEDSNFEPKLKHCLQLLKTHAIQHEEKESLPEFERHCSAECLNELGQKFLSEKSKAPPAPHPEAPHDPTMLKMAGMAAKPIDEMKEKLQKTFQGWIEDWGKKKIQNGRREKIFRVDQRRLNSNEIL